MSLETFKQIIDKQYQTLIWLILYFQGEPYLNKSFFEMVSYAKSRKFFTTTSTNGHFLTKENALKTIESGLDRLLISIDGLDQLTYEKYRVGGNLEKVKQGIQNLVEAKKETGKSHPFIVIQFIVFKTNEHQLEEAKKLKKTLGVDKVEIKTAQVYSQNDKNQLIPDNKKHRRYQQNENGEWTIKKEIPNKCNRMWRAAVVTWDAQVVPCCFDKDADFQMGNLLEKSFEEIKNTEKYTNFRNQVFTNRKQIDICRNCSEGL
jgi:radical SAM protein with 4Fe4S-binding SPASM domain